MVSWIDRSNIKILNNSRQVAGCQIYLTEVYSGSWQVYARDLKSGQIVQYGGSYSLPYAEALAIQLSELSSLQALLFA